MVSADFPGINSQQRQKIYDCLREKNWIKVIEHGRDIDTVWYASFQADVSEESAIKITIREFVSCSQPFCSVKLSIQWGPHKPTFYGLT